MLRIKSFLKALEYLFPTERDIHVKENHDAENRTNICKKFKHTTGNTPPSTVRLQLALAVILSEALDNILSF